MVIEDTQAHARKLLEAIKNENEEESLKFAGELLGQLCNDINRIAWALEMIAERLRG